MSPFRDSFFSPDQFFQQRITAAEDEPQMSHLGVSNESSVHNSPSFEDMRNLPYSPSSRNSDSSSESDSNEVDGGLMLKIRQRHSSDHSISPGGSSLSVDDGYYSRSRMIPSTSSAGTLDLPLHTDDAEHIPFKRLSMSCSDAAGLEQEVVETSVPRSHRGSRHDRMLRRMTEEEVVGDIRLGGDRRSTITRRKIDKKTGKVWIFLIFFFHI